MYNNESSSPGNDNYFERPYNEASTAWYYFIGMSTYTGRETIVIDFIINPIHHNHDTYECCNATENNAPT